jgi:signal transduction histidine kinase
MRMACAVLLVVYTLILVSRWDPAHPAFAYLRGAVCLYALFGILIAGRVGWRGVRGYTVGLGFLLPLLAMIVGGVLGHQAHDLAVTALANIVPMLFLQTLADVLIVLGGVLAGELFLIAVLPPPAMPLTNVLLVLGGSLAAGAVMQVITMFYRTALQQGLAWWQRACERERELREFTETTASEVRSEGLLDDLAERFRAAFGGGRTAVVLGGEAAGPFSVVAAAGEGPDVGEAPGAAPLAAEIAPLVRQSIESRQPVVREVPSLVVLPLVVEGAVAGVVVMTRPERRAISADELLHWQAMANQTGVAIANGRLLARLERALRAKSEFLSTMSHELRSPLHVVMGYADMLREGAEALDAGDVGERIRRSALDLLRLVEDTLTVAQLEAGRVTVRTDDFSPADVLSELVEGLQALPEAQHGVPVRWEIQSDLPPVRLDRLKFKEIVQNLVSNALKYTPAGEVRVTVAGSADELTVAVRDTGPGIARDVQGRIFEMFERVDQSDGRRPPGVGLGLYIVDRLVHAMQGSVELWSAPGEGSVFTVRLPTRLGPAPSAA